MIDILNVTRSFGSARPALSGVSFSVAGGCVTGLLGPNGAGKTTLFRILAGILRPQAGRVVICGHDTTSDPARARALTGLLTEEPGLPDRLTPLWHVALHATLRGFTRSDALLRSGKWLDHLGAGAVLDRPHGTLSKGTRAKVALARALVHEPLVLLLDEPTANLDIETSAEIRRKLLDRARDGCAVLVATHDPAEAEHLCERFVILGKGRVLAAGSLDELRSESKCAPRIEVRLSGPAHRVLESARRVAGSWSVQAMGDRLVIAGPAHVQDAGPTDGPTAMELVAAAAPLEVVELRRERAPLEQVYLRLQERTA